MTIKTVDFKLPALPRRGFLWALFLLAFHLTSFSVMAQKPKSPTMLSVAEILSNYGLDTLMVNDTSYVLDFLESQPQDYLELTNYCVSLRTKVQQAVNSIENDYPHRDNLVWLDSNTVLSDYSIYEYRLRRLADLLGKMSIRYSRLEQQRIEAEKEAARQRAIEEAARQQRQRDSEAADLRNNIDLHHRYIISACDGAGIKDKNRLKELKDLYYSYLMVYNKYDLSTGHATPESIVQLDELNSFQNDLIENVLGPNSLPSQIENFKNQLKVRCDKDDSEVFRSYSRMFRQTSVPVSFADVNEYGNYISTLQTIINVQNRYLQTLDLRATIESETDKIIQLFGKKYRDVVNSYKEVLRSINLVPAFTNNAESINFIHNLEDFVTAQHRYQDLYPLFEDISSRSDTILKGVDSKFRDVVSSYRDVQSSLVPMPSFKNALEADHYEEQLAEVVKVQRYYLQVIEKRHEIEQNDDTLMNSRKVDKVLYNGYRLLRKQADLQPTFSTPERGNSFIALLNSHIEMQRLCKQIVQKRRTIDSYDQKISDKVSPYRNIGKAYSRMMKAYDDFGEIANTEDLRRYSRQCDVVVQVQEAFLKLLSSDLVSSTDTQLKRETDIEKIKAAIGFK